jgi:hypothetical protein
MYLFVNCVGNIVIKKRIDLYLFHLTIACSRRPTRRHAAFESRCEAPPPGGAAKAWPLGGLNLTIEESHNADPCLNGWVYYIIVAIIY